MSIGSPIETAVKLNAMQRLSATAARHRRRLRDRRRRSSARRLLPAQQHLPRRRDDVPAQMALGATRDTSLAYQAGTHHRARGARARRAHRVRSRARRQQQSGESGHRRAVVRRGSAPRRRDGRGVHSRSAGARDDRDRKALSRARRHGRELAPHRSPPFTRVARASTPWSSSRSRRAIAAGVQGMMTFHGVIPALDTASGSRDAQSGDHDRAAAQAARLQGSAHHRRDGHERRPRRASPLPAAPAGPTATGNYGTIDNALSIGEACKLALVAGADVLLMPSDVPAAIDAVVDGVSRRTIHAGARRLVGAANSRDQAAARPRPTAAREPRQRAGDRRRHGSPRGRRACRATLDHAREGLARTSFRSLAPRRRPTPRVLSITIASRTDLPAGATFNAELRRVDERPRRVGESRRSVDELRSAARRSPTRRTSPS